MQYLKMSKNMTLSDLSNIVGERNVDYVLNANLLERTVNIGEAFYSREVADVPVDYQQKLGILNQFVGDSDLYEKAALSSESEWQVLSQYNNFLDAVRIPIEVKLPPSEGVLGNGEPISDKVYNDCVTWLKNHELVNPNIFADYNAYLSGGSYGITGGNFGVAGEVPFQWFNFPWGEIVLYSHLNKDQLHFPVYPETLDDGYQANYEDMPEMLYQYEPWKVYKSSGPREVTFTFKFHRDMWTGDHRDGGANNLIRGCQANCFPKYNGSLVNVPVVTMYIHGDNFITGVMTSCKVNWYGPIGLDGFYLFCDLSLTIVEVSDEALNMPVIRNKGLIG